MKFNRILVPVGGGEADVEAIRTACALAKQSKGKIYVLYVICIKRTFPLDAEMEPDIHTGQAILELATKTARELDCGVETEILQAREAGPAIVDVAVEHNADLILMGMGHKRRFGEYTMGNTVPYVLKDAPCAVLIYREPIPGELSSKHK